MISNLRVYYSPDFVQAPRRLTILRCGPRWVMIFSSDIRACFSLERAVAGRRHSNHDYHHTQSNRQISQPATQPRCLSSDCYNQSLYLVVKQRLYYSVFCYCISPSLFPLLCTSWIKTAVSWGVTTTLNIFQFFSNILVLNGLAGLIFCAIALIYYCSALKAY